MNDMDRISCIIVHPDPAALSDLAAAASEAGLDVRDALSQARGLAGRIHACRPHAVFLHALTPALDPEALRDSLTKLPLFRRPALIWLVPGLLPARQREALTPRLLLPCGGEEMRAAAENALPLPVDDALLRRAEALAEQLGLAEGAARTYLAFAAALVYNDAEALTPLSHRILPALSARFGVSPRQAADAMRRLIDRAFTTGDIEAQYAFFGNTIDEKRGKPTLTAFIATAAERMRQAQDR